MEIRILLVITIALWLIGCEESTVNSQVALSQTVISEPTLFAPGIISTEENNEFELNFSPDGKTVYFTRRVSGAKQKIYIAQFKDGKWSKPKVGAFSTDRDETPFITPDGKNFFFGSERPIPGKPNRGGFDMNIWMMEQTPDGWSEPKPLPEPINNIQVEGENWPSSNTNFITSIDNKTFYFTTMRRGKEAIDVYRTEFDGTNFSEPELIEGFFDDIKLWKYLAVLSPDGNYMLFNTYGAPQGFGGEDIYVSRRTADGWSKAKNIGSLVNSKNEESSPRFSPDGKYFFFGRSEVLENDEYGNWSIYFVETEYLKLDDLFRE